MVVDSNQAQLQEDSTPAREDADCEERRCKKHLALLDRGSSYRHWLLGSQEKAPEGFVREYLGLSARSVSHLAGAADGGRKLQCVRLQQLLKLGCWKLWQRTRLERCSQLCTQRRWFSRATRRSWLASLSHQGHLALPLLILRIRRRKWPRF